MNRICPSCGSKNIAKMLYGKPAFSEELQNLLDNKKIKLGGCIITGDDPKYYCNECETKFDSSTTFIKELITKIDYRYGGWDNAISYTFTQDDKGKLLIKDKLSRDNIYHHQISFDEFIIKVLSCHVLDWNETYFNPDIIDGTQWDLTLFLENDDTIEKGGSNHFPPHFKHLQRFISKTLKQVNAYTKRY